MRILSKDLDRLGERAYASTPFLDCLGKYEVRWYVSTKHGKLCEVARANFPSPYQGNTRV
jgi:hypothetical protein